MQKNDKLLELIEKAATCTNMLSSDDFSEVSQLQAVFEKIDKKIKTIKDVPELLIQQTKDTTSGISELLQEMLAEDVKNPDTLIDSVSQAVMSLQGLVDQVINPQPVVEFTEVKDQTADAAADVLSETRIEEDDIPLVQDFIAESNEHIESAEAGLLELETKPDDKEVLNLIFRGFHTIKGMAGFLNLAEIGSLAHSTENLLDLARKGELLMVGENMDVVFESIDMLKSMIASLLKAIESGSTVSAQKELPSLLNKIDACSNLQDNAASSEPAADVEKPPQADQTVPTVAETEEGIAESVAVSAAAEIETSNESKTESAAQSSNVRKESDLRGTASDEKIKVSTTRLDNLVNMSGELVIAQLMVAEEASRTEYSQYELNRKIAHQGKIIRELQELSMSMRMVQIAGVFQKMTRLVRDVSRKAEKRINFVTAGEETELDRSIVDKIADPLIHMLRNSVDHGVESPADRKQVGKDPVGTIELRAFHEAGNIVIEIEDDGKGLDKERILKKAVENGVVDADQQMTEDQIYKLIFHAGLSTAQKITSVSGRGVGMDVVKKNIESLRGRIDIASTPGKGTVFTIRLPLTLAMIDGQIVKVGSNRYIIPINSIIGTLRPQTQQISTVQGRLEMVLVRGELLPLVRLYKQFEVEPATEDPAGALLVIVEDDGRRCCLLVDDLLAQQRVVIKSLGEGLGKVDCVSGGAIMGDGKVSLILDVPSIMKLAQD